MYREAILEFIKRKDEILEGEYIPDHTPEELWPYGEKDSKHVARNLSSASDISFCPWCLIHKGCDYCEYGRAYGSCITDATSNYTTIQEKVTDGQSITDYIEENGAMEYIFEPIWEALESV